MKGLNVFIVILLIAIIIYLYMISKKANALAATKPSTVTNYNSGYDLGLSLANLIANTKCGKNGLPPCTKDELIASGWTPDQIAVAEQGSATASSASNSALCALGLGFNC